MFESHGIAGGRVDMQGHIKEKGSHLGAYGRVDIALNTLPYNGVTTSCEAMWMGVPVVALEGASHAGRLSSSILHALGLEYLVTGSEDEFVAAATRLAENRKALWGLRAGPGLARAVKAAYRDMWRAWCASSGPVKQSEPGSA